MVHPIVREIYREINEENGYDSKYYENNLLQKYRKIDILNVLLCKNITLVDVNFILIYCCINKWYAAIDRILSMKNYVCFDKIPLKEWYYNARDGLIKSVDKYKYAFKGCDPNGEISYICEQIDDFLSRMIFYELENYNKDYVVKLIKHGVVTFVRSGMECSLYYDAEPRTNNELFMTIIANLDKDIIKNSEIEIDYKFIIECYDADNRPLIAALKKGGYIPTDTDLLNRIRYIEKELFRLFLLD